MPIAAGITAVGGLAGAFLQSNAAKSAANTYAQTAQQGIDAQKAMFAQAQGALSPYYTAGAGALPTLKSLLTPGASMTDTLSALPGFKFASEWGTRAATNQLAAEGLGGSTGPLAKAISDYNSGLASTYWGNLVGNLQNFVNTGATSASALAGNATQTGQGISNTLSGIGQALAQGTTGSAGALAGGIGSLGNAAMLYALGSKIGVNSGSSIYGGIQSLGLGNLIPGFNPIGG